MAIRSWYFEITRLKVALHVHGILGAFGIVVAWQINGDFALFSDTCTTCVHAGDRQFLKIIDQQEIGHASRRN